MTTEREQAAIEAQHDAFAAADRKGKLHEREPFDPVLVMAEASGLPYEKLLFVYDRGAKAERERIVALFPCLNDEPCRGNVACENCHARRTIDRSGRY